MAGIPGGCKKVEISFDAGVTKLDLGAPKKQGTGIDPKVVNEEMADGNKRMLGVGYDISVAVPDLVTVTKTAITTAIAAGTKGQLYFTTFDGKLISTVAMDISLSNKPEVADPSGASQSYMITGSAFGQLPSNVLTIV